MKLLTNSDRKEVCVPVILLIEKEVEERKRLVSAVQGAGYVVSSVASTVDALVAVSEQVFDVVILNESIFSDSGMSVINAVHAHSPDAQVIVIVDSSESFDTVLKQGPLAYDLFLKSSNPKLLIHRITRALEFKQALRSQRLLEGANKSLRQHLDEQAELSLQLEQELQKLKRIMQMVGVPIAVISKERTVLWSNRAYEALLSNQEGVYCLHAACSGVRCKQCVLDDIFSGRRQYSRAEVESQIPDANVCWFEIIDTPLLGVNDEILGVVELALPIDERKKDQLALQEAKKTLEQGVAQRTLSLKESNDRLEHEIEIRKSTERRMLAELELNAAVAALANSLVTGSESLEEVAGSALEYALSFTNSNMGFVTKINADTDSNQILAHKGITKKCLGRLLAGFEGDVAETQPVHTHFGQRPFFTNNVKESRLPKFPQGHPAIANCINAPVIVEGRLGGMIVTANSEKEYTYDDLGAVLRMSSLFALALQRWNKEHELIRAKSIAEDANKAKTQFLANMSHELRTPLNGIMGSARVLLELGPEHEQREFLDLIMKSGGQLLMLINDLLVLSNLELKRFSTSSVQFCLHEMLEGILGLYQAQASQKGLDFFVSINSDVPSFLTADSNCFKLVLSNLITNAIQFTAEGRIGLSMELAGVPIQDKDSGEYHTQLLVSVSDTGQGIPQNMHEEIFEQFTLVEDCMTKRYGGAGLGLSICRQLVTLMGGDIWVESELGKGSTFSFVVDVGLELGATQDECLAGPPHKVVPATSLHVLYAEDEFTNQELVKRFMEKRGHTVVIANDGLEALDRLRLDPNFDLVLMDLKMPRVDGIEATRKIRCGECGNVDSQIPIIAVTAFASEREEIKGREVGLDAYITKPVDLVNLLESMHRVVALKQRGR